MTLTGATLFTGFGGADIGMQNAGITPLWGIEHDADIAEVAQDNGIPVTVANLLNCDPSEFPPVDVLHASPPCPNFSIAKTGAKEAALDKSLSSKVAEFIATLMPRVFTLENVWAYRHSDVTWRDGNEPVYTMTASMYKRPTRGSVQGRVVKLSVRALARLQGFPDSYRLPESNKLACKGIGNACPPLGMQKIFEQLRTIQISCIITELR